MSLIFHHLPSNLSRTLALRALQRQRSIEQIAIEALERGLAFNEELAEEGESVTDGESWIEGSVFEEALR